jgi:lambda repressor-like predicted transcriptional regulator
MNESLIHTTLISQYKASLRMLRKALEKTPNELWNDTESHNPVWQIGYHVLWSTKFYLEANPESYVPWANAIEGAESLGGSEEWENPEEGIALSGYHPREELLSFAEDLESTLPQSIKAIPLDNDSGFEWYPFSRLELHLNNIRHIQHHTAQIIERLKQKGLRGFPWD